MKIGVITDVHNNLTALKAVVEKLWKSGCEKIICCGDILGYQKDQKQRADETNCQPSS